MNRAVAICYLYLRDPREGVSIGAVDAVDHPDGNSLSEGNPAADASPAEICLSFSNPISGKNCPLEFLLRK